MTDSTIEQSLLAGGGVAVFLIFIAFTWWVLTIVLFFKIWAMTNDVESIKELLKEWLDLEHPEEDNGSEEDPAKIIAE